MKRIVFYIIVMSLISCGSTSNYREHLQIESNFENDNIAPFGSNPSEEFETTTFFDEENSTYMFEFSGVQKIVYYLPISDQIVQKGMIKIGAQIDDNSLFYPVVAGGTRYLTQSKKLLEPEEFANNSDIKLIGHSLENGIVTLEYKETYQGIMNEKTIEYSIKGKTIVIHAFSDNTNGTNNYYGFSFGASANTPNPKPIEIPFMSEPLVIFDKQMFFSTYLDRTKSNSVFFSKIMRIISPDSIKAYLISSSSPDSDDNIVQLDETGYVTASTDVHDVMPQINNPPSPYREILNNKAILDIWSTFYNDFGYWGQVDTYKANKAMLESLHEYGLDNLAIIYHDWQAYGYDVKLPTHAPANQMYGSEDDFREMIETAKSYNYLFALHENYVDSYQDSQYYNENDIAKDIELNPVQAYFNQWSGQQAYKIASDKALKYAEFEGQKIMEKYSPNAAYLDIQTAVYPSDFIDFDASNPNEKSYSSAITNLKTLFLHQKNQYNGPLFGEGIQEPYRFDSYYAGYVDGVERQIDGNYLAKNIPDFELLSVKPLMVNQGMGYYDRYFFTNPGASTSYSLFQTYTPINDQQWDQYRASEIAFGHAAFISISNQFSHFFPLDTTFTEYYLLQAIQNQYLSSIPSSILYEIDGKMVPLEQALANQIDFINNHLLIQYQNGLNIYLNFDRGSNYSYYTQDYTQIQGYEGWSYLYWNGNRYNDMNSNLTNWQGNAEYCLIGQGWVHPSLYCQPTLSWKSPIETTIHIEGQVADQSPECGNGVIAEIYRNNDVIWNGKINNGDDRGEQIDLSVPVKADDNIYFRISANGDQDCDSTFLTPIISYQYPLQPWEVSVNDVKYSIPSSGWVAWNDNTGFLEYSAIINDKRVDYVESKQYSFARSRDGILSDVGKVKLDGIAVFEKSDNSNTNDLHFVQSSRVEEANPKRPILFSSEKCDLNLIYQDKNHIQLILHNANSELVDVQYFDFPVDWYITSSSALNIEGITIREINTIDNQAESPISWSATSDNKGISITGLPQDKWYEIEYKPLITDEIKTKELSDNAKINQRLVFLIITGLIISIIIICFFLIMNKKRSRK